LDNYKNDQSDLPVWMINQENYIPQTDKDTFVNKSILSLLGVISRIRSQDNHKTEIFKVNATLKVTFTFLLILLLSLSRSFLFVLIINVYLLSLLSLMSGERIIKILKLSLGMALFTFVIMLPATFGGNSYSGIMITTKTFATITAVGILSHSTDWGSITSALKRFFIPDLFVLVLDITIKYIVMLGDFTLNMMYALKLRSVGRNKNKYSSISGIAGTLFIKSKEMSEDMYQAMICRGFTGEYHSYQRSKLTMMDCFYIMINIGILFVFIYFGRI
jgi:ABC-type cobalt transport system, permease component CbiQ and related transporters